jgi:tol-pal system protein YbgF
MASQLGVSVDALNVTDTGVSYQSTQPSSAGQAQNYAPPAGSDLSADSGITPGQSSTDKAAALYDSGIRSFDQRRYKDAAVAFKEFSASYPKHKLTGNAHFWEGESYFQMQDYPRAALAYQEVIANFPGSPKLQSAMLKQGKALFLANKKPAARERLQELIKRYPNSPESTQAKQFLAANK